MVTVTNEFFSKPTFTSEILPRKMPPNKKAQQNAFYYYMIDLMNELKATGYNFPNGLADVVPLAGPKWKQLSIFDKAPYEELAQKAKNKKNNGSNKDTRLDCTGMKICERLEPVDELSLRFQEQEQVVTSKWSFQTETDLLKTKFCFINFQTMCKTIDDEYPPLEVAAIEYCMNDGITKEFHQFINAGEIPVGYRYEAQLHSDTTHKIPIVNFELAQSDYSELWLKLSAFAEEADLFCLSRDFKEMEYCLNWIRYRSGIDCKPIKLYALEKLVMDLFKFARHPVAKYQILDMLTTTAFDYEPQTRCTWHEENGIIHCSLAIIRRFAYAMSDSLTNVYDFNLTAHHLPVKDQRIKGITLNPTQFSSRKSNTFRQNLQRSLVPPKQAALSPESSDNDENHSEPDLEALRMPESTSLTFDTLERRPGKDSYIRSEANFPSLGRGSARPEQNIRQSVRTSVAPCWQRPRQDLQTSMNRNPPEAPRSRPQQSTSLAAATLNTISKNCKPDSPSPGGVWARPQKAPESEVVPSLENFPALSSTIVEDRSRKSGRGPQGGGSRVGLGGHSNSAPLCFAAMAGRGRGRGIRAGVNPPRI